MPVVEEVAVLGTGSFGRGLGAAVRSAGVPVLFWGRSYKSIQRAQSETPPGDKSWGGCSYTISLEELKRCSHLILAIPTQALGEVLEKLKAVFSFDLCQNVLLTSKGVHEDTGKFPLEIFQSIFPDHPGAGFLGGPNFAAELLGNQVTRFSIFSSDSWRHKFGPSFKVLDHPDPWSLQVSGAFKNMVALAMGFLEAIGMGKNAQASFFAQGFQDMVSLVHHLGEKHNADLRSRAFFQDGVLGDFFLTCASARSRNYKFGYDFGKSLVSRPPSSMEEFLKDRPLAEGYVGIPGAAKRIRDEGISLRTVEFLEDVFLELEEVPLKKIRSLLLGP